MSSELSRQSYLVRVPSKSALIEAASVLTYEANRAGARAERQVDYLDAASVLADLAQLADTHGDRMVEAHRAE